MENEEMILPEEAPIPVPDQEEPAAEAAENEEVSQEAAEKAPEEAQETPAEEPEKETEEDPEDPEAPEVPKRRPNFRHALRFLVGLFALSLCALVLLCCAMEPLKRWLTELESLRPEYTDQQVYEMVFADPDWDLIYDLAGVEGTVFEGKDTFVAYMETKLKGKDLTCTRISDGLSGDRRFVLRDGDETIVSFTMTETSGDPLYPNWTLGTVEVYFTREQSVTVMTHPDYTVYINGVALDDSYIIAASRMAAEDHIPEGLHADRTVTMQVNGLLCEPTIEVVDRSLTKQDIYYSADLDLYSTLIPTTEPITDEELTMVTEAAKMHALFDVRGCNIAKLRKYFDANSPAYAQLSKAEPFCEGYKSHKLNEKKIYVSDFYRYSDELFSVHVKLKMNVTTKEGETLKYALDTTYFFALMPNGAYRVIDLTDADLMAKRYQVRLTYVYNGETLLSQLVDTDAKTYPAPEFEDGAPTAWGIPGEDGTITPMLKQNKKGAYVLAGDAFTEAVTLYPVFD